MTVDLPLEETRIRAEGILEALEREAQRPANPWLNPASLGVLARDVLALLSEVTAQRGEDWVPTTNIDATCEEMRKRGLGRWVDSFQAWLGSASAYYTASAYKTAVGDAAIAEKRAVAAEAVVVGLREQLRAVLDLRSSDSGRPLVDNNQARKMLAALTPVEVGNG